MLSLKKKLQFFWEKEQSLTILCVILVIHIFIIIPVGETNGLQKIISLFFYISLLSAGMFMVTDNKAVRIFSSAVLGLLAFSSTGFFFMSTTLEIANDAVGILYFILLSWVVLIRTFKDGPITIHRILGAIVVYLLSSLIFALLYHSIHLLNPETAFKGLTTSGREEFMYFSITTLTTVGYGDITPAIASARSLANLEALIGQLYPAILIARLVSMEFDYSKRK